VALEDVEPLALEVFEARRVGKARLREFFYQGEFVGTGFAGSGPALNRFLRQQTIQKPSGILIGAKLKG
jgi:hypothetical protein